MTKDARGPATERLLSGTLIDEQIATETNAINAGVARYHRLARKSVDRGDGSALKPAERMLLHWYQPFRASIQREQRAIRRGAPGIGRGVFGPYLLTLPASKIAVIAMHEIVGQCMAQPTGVPINRLSYAVGRGILGEATLMTMRRTDREALEVLNKKVRRLSVRAVNWIGRKRSLIDPVWTKRVNTHMGARLIWLFIEIASAAGYDEDFVLAFHHERRRIGRKKMPAFLRMDQAVFRIIDQGHGVRQFMRPRYGPMIVVPFPWKDDADGGYATVHTPFISKIYPCQRAALESADLSQVYAALNAVNSTPWRINRRVFEVMKRVWESGGGAVGVPHRDDFPVPPHPPGFVGDAKPTERWAQVDPRVKRKWKQEAAPICQHNEENRGPRKNFLHKLTIAERLVDRPAIYFPHQLDFRGRAYPIPLYLNHQGDDVCRGLLEFAEARAVPTTDVSVAIHAANCYGIDKCPFSERIRWVDDHQSLIDDTVSNPMSTWDWWSAADKRRKPWQFLAACFALGSGHAAEHLAIQFDGTCNGLQHYAALGRDAEGAAAVNLLPADAPNSVYADVAKVVRHLIGRDAEMGAPWAVAIEQMIDVELVKRTVMTSVYGVTFVGGRKQIYEQLRDHGLEGKDVYECSFYLSRVVMKGLESVCTGARAIMDWLAKCARIISQPPNRSLVSWTTPLGLPVVQHYRLWRRMKVLTILQKIMVSVADERVPVAPGAQCAGFPPNFIHSVDATHMMMTALECQRAGVTFASVHDSYWTHAADAGTLNRILREQFVALHEQPILEDLRQSFVERYPAVKLPELPPTGDLDLPAVLDSPYFFS